MATANGLERIRTAVGALNAGEATVDDVERLIRDALVTGTVSKRDAFRAVRGAANNRAASHVIQRLGLDDAHILDDIATRQTRIRLVGDRERAAAPGAPPRGGAAARADVPGRREPYIGDALGGLPKRPSVSGPPFAEDPPAGTDALWVDPDPTVAPGADDSLVGQVLGGRYRLERELGRGGMGVVYLASDQEVTGELFAIKVLRPEIRSYPEALPLLREEVRTTRALKHPHIVGVYSLNSDKNNIYMLMEYLEGKTLDALLDQEFARGMPFSRAWPLIQDMCDALAYAHDHNVIHSDLKPSNVFITMSMRAKLLDFGIARVARTRAGRFDPASVGALTMAYATCEMLEGRQPDQSDDVYAMACIIYEMLSGRHPFGLKSAREARDEGLFVTPIPTLSQSQNAALADALAFERSYRTATIEALLAGLDWHAPPRTAGAAPTVLRPAVARQPPPRAAGSPAKTSTLRYAIAAAGLVAVLVALGAFLWWRAPGHSTVGNTAPSGSGIVVPRTVPPEPAPAPASEIALAPTVTAGDSPALTAADPVVPPVASTMPMPAPAPATPTAGPPASDVQPREPGQEAAPSPLPYSPVLPSPLAKSTRAPKPAIPADPTGSAPSVGDPSVGAALAVASAASAAPTVPPVPRKPEAVKPLPDAEADINDDGKCPYPKHAKDLAITGTVQLLVLIAPDGSVSQVQVERGSDSPELDEAARSCVQQFGRFAPRRLSPKSAGYWGHMSVGFGV